MAQLYTQALQEWLKRSESRLVDRSLGRRDEDLTLINMNTHEPQPVADIILSVSQR